MAGQAEAAGRTSRGGDAPAGETRSEAGIVSEACAGAPAAEADASGGRRIARSSHHRRGEPRGRGGGWGGVRGRRRGGVRGRMEHGLGDVRDRGGAVPGGFERRVGEFEGLRRRDAEEGGAAARAARRGAAGRVAGGAIAGAAEAVGIGSARPRIVGATGAAAGTGAGAGGTGSGNGSGHSTSGLASRSASTRNARAPLRSKWRTMSRAASCGLLLQPGVCGTWSFVAKVESSPIVKHTGMRRRRSWASYAGRRTCGFVPWLTRGSLPQTSIGLGPARNSRLGGAGDAPPGFGSAGSGRAAFSAAAGAARRNCAWIRGRPHYKSPPL